MAVTVPSDARVSFTWSAVVSVDNVLAAPSSVTAYVAASVYVVGPCSFCRVMVVAPVGADELASGSVMAFAGVGADGGDCAIRGQGKTNVQRAGEGRQRTGHAIERDGVAGVEGVRSRGDALVLKRDGGSRGSDQHTLGRVMMFVPARSLRTAKRVHRKNGGSVIRGEDDLGKAVGRDVGQGGGCAVERDGSRATDGVGVRYAIFALEGDGRAGGRGDQTPRHARSLP